MIHLIWSIVNTILAIYFLYLIIGFIRKGKKIFNNRFKLISIFIIVIGIFQLIDTSYLDKNPERIIITEGYENSNSKEMKFITIEDNLTFDINLHVTYLMQENEFVPIECKSFLSGFVSGFEWEIKTIQTGKYNLNDKGAFKGNGILKWNFFGIEVYRQDKTIQGVFI